VAPFSGHGVVTKLTMTFSLIIYFIASYQLSPMRIKLISSTASGNALMLLLRSPLCHNSVKIIEIGGNLRSSDKTILYSFF